MRFFCCEKAALAAANKICPQWAVQQVQPIVFNFAERCYYYLLTTNDKPRAEAACRLCRGAEV